MLIISLFYIEIIQARKIPVYTKLTTMPPVLVCRVMYIIIIFNSILSKNISSPRELFHICSY